MMFTMIVVGLIFTFTSIVLGVALTDKVIMPLVSEQARTRKAIEEFVTQKETDPVKVVIFFVIWFACGAYLFG